MLKVGLIGAGYIAKCHIEAWSQLENVNISAVCDKDKKRAEEIAQKYNSKILTDLNNLLNSGIDVLDVCLPTKFHFETVMAAIDKKIPVLCEKPISLSFEEAEIMIKKAKSENVLLMIAHCIRFEPHYAYLKKSIEEKTYGNLHSLRIFRNSSTPVYSESQWLLNTELSGGVAMDLHIHDVDLIYWMLGAPKWVFTQANAFSIATSYGYDEFLISSEASWRKQKLFTFQAGFDAHFEKATLEFNYGKLKIIKDLEIQEINNFTELNSYPQISTPNLYNNEILYFYNCIMNGEKPNYCSPIDSLAAHQLTLLEIESSKQEKKLNFKNNGGL